MITNTVCEKCEGKCCSGCKYFNKSVGCTQNYNDRYLSCKLYPFVNVYPFVKDKSILLLDPDCPGWKSFGEKYKEAHELILEAG